MKRLVNPTRQFGLLLGLSLVVGIVAPQAVSASNVTPQGPSCFPCQQHPPQFSIPTFTKIHA